MQCRRSAEIAFSRVYQCEHGPLIMPKAHTTPSPFHFPLVRVEIPAQKAGAGLAQCCRAPNAPQSSGWGAQE